MFVLEVIPFSRTAPGAPLSYRSRVALPTGTLLTVPLRRKNVLGLVVGSVPVQEAKAELKTASFSLSKASENVQGELPPQLLKAAAEVATYHATTLGAVLSALLVPVLPQAFSGMKFNSAKRAPKRSIDYINAPLIERKELYKKYIADSTETTLLVVPTQTEADEWAALLKEFKPLVLSGRITGASRELQLEKTTQPGVKLLISTPGFAWVPIPSLERVIIERVSAGTYSLPKRPYVDVRYALTKLAEERKVEIVYADYPLPIEYRGELKASSRTNQNMSRPENIQLVDTRTEKSDQKKQSAQWKAIPDELRAEIESALEEKNGRVAILAVRKGYAPTVVCRDCGTAVTDDSGRVLSLATLGGKRVYRSPDGKVFDSVEIFCKVCGGWNLQPLGVGIERVEEELRTAFSSTQILRIDQDTRTTASLKKIRSEIQTPGIIIGTELMLPFISPYEKVTLGIIASADSLLSLPFWRSRERFLRIGYMLGERSEKVIVATRHPEDAAVESLAHSQSEEFWTEETNLRKMLSYPPFGTLIVFHVEGTAARLEEARAAITTACTPFVPILMQDRYAPKKVESEGEATLNQAQARSSLVLQLPQGAWPDDALSKRLASLSPAIRITIDSEMLW